MGGMSKKGALAGSHIELHLNDSGICVCLCQECTARATGTTGTCICPDCLCEGAGGASHSLT